MILSQLQAVLRSIARDVKGPNREVTRLCQKPDVKNRLRWGFIRTTKINYSFSKDKMKLCKQKLLNLVRLLE